MQREASAKKWNALFVSTGANNSHLPGMDMGEELGVIWLLAIGLGLACLFGYLAQRAKQSPILGYLLAGFVIGPNSPGFVADPHIAEQLANIGITLLMFAVGLGFHWKDLLAVKKISLPGALILALCSIAAGMLYTVFLGGSWVAGFVIGFAICVSSTVVIVRVLTDKGLLHTQQGHIMIGWTIVEDLISIFGLLLLPSLAAKTFAENSSFLPIFYQIGWVLVKIMMLGLFVYFLGSRIIETLLKIVSRTKSHELFTLAILASTFLIAMGSSYIFGVSLALGAFIAGTIVGQTDMSHQAAANALPMRDTFAVIFFLSVGMLFNPLAVMNNLPLLFGILAILLVLRPLIGFCIMKTGQYATPVALTVALSTSPIGEYSFILADEGSRLGILPDNAFDVLVASSFITIAITPMLFQLFYPYYSKYLNTRGPPADLQAQSFNESSKTLQSSRPKAVVIGFGPVGQEAVKHLLRQCYHVVVVDRNIDTISSLKKNGIETIFGDAAQSHILEQANVATAELMVITIPEFDIAQSIIKTAKEINPSIKMIARSHFKLDPTTTNTPHMDDIPTICDEETSSEKLISAIDLQLTKIAKATLAKMHEEQQ